MNRYDDNYPIELFKWWIATGIDLEEEEEVNKEEETEPKEDTNVKST